MMTLRSKRRVGNVESDIVKNKMPRLDLDGAAEMATFTPPESVVSDSDNTLVDVQYFDKTATAEIEENSDGGRESEDEDTDQRQFTRSAAPEPDSPDHIGTGSDKSGVSDNLKTGISQGDDEASEQLNKLRQSSKAGKSRSKKVFAAMTNLKNPDLIWENHVLLNALYVTSISEEEEDPWPNREGCHVLSINKSFAAAVDELVYYFDEIGEMDDIMDAFNDKHMNGVPYQNTDEEQRDALLEMAKVGRLNPSDPDWSMIVEVESGSFRHIAKVEVMEIGG